MDAVRFQILFPGYSEATLQFLNRTNGVTRSSADLYAALIDGLVSDGLWSFDLLYVFAAQDATTARTNLAQSSFACTANGAPAFAAYRGYTGVDSSSTVYLDTGYNQLNSSVSYTQNSAHVSVWNNLDIAASGGGGGAQMGIESATSTTQTFIFSLYNDSLAYLRMNEANPGAGVSTAGWGSKSSGFYVANRSGSTAEQGYRNASQILTSTQISGALNNANIYLLAADKTGTGGELGSANQLGAASAGAGLTAAQVQLFYSRLGTYMAAVGNA